MGRSVSEAAAQAVRKSEKTKAVDRTPEQIIADIRRNLGARLAVTPDDQRFLLAKYDEHLSGLTALSAINEGLAEQAASAESLLHRALTAEAEVVRLNEQVEQFRTVYEAENRSQAVKVERVAEPVDNFTVDYQTPKTTIAEPDPILTYVSDTVDATDMNSRS